MSAPRSRQSCAASTRPLVARGEERGSFIPRPRTVDLGVVVEAQSHCVDVALSASDVERRQAVLRDAVDVGAAFEDQPHHVYLVLFARMVKR